MMVRMPNNANQVIRVAAERIEMINERIQSPARMEGRNAVSEMEQIIRAAREIIEMAEVVKIMNIGKDK